MMLLAILFMFAANHLQMLQTGPLGSCTGQQCTVGVCTGLCAFITSPYVVWFPIVLLAVLLIIIVLAVIYQLSPLLGRNDIRAWVRVKIYDELATIVLIFIFASFGTLIFFIQPAQGLNSVGLIPTDQPPGSGTYLSTSCYGYAINPPAANGNNANPVQGVYADYNNIYFISLCDMYTFNNDVNTFSEGLFWIASISAFAPTVQYSFPSQGFLTGVGTWFQNYNFSNVGISFNLELLPIEPVFFYIVPFMNTIYVLFVASQVQQLLVAASGLIFAIFMAIGLVARAFGVTRTFGNAMIAFAIGIGFIYPIMIMLTYGFLDSSLTPAGDEFICTLGLASLTNSAINCGGVIGPIANGGTWTSLGGFLGTGISDALGAIVGPVLTGTLMPASIVYIVQAFLVYGGLVAIGLTFIPLLNLTIVDVFIIDFSRSMGERMDFLSLFTRLL